MRQLRDDRHDSCSVARFGTIGQVLRNLAILDAMKRLICLALLAACSNDPVDAEGTYTLAVTNRDNGCNFTGWTIGDSASNIPVTINQEGANADAIVMGLTGTYVSAVLGSNVFQGKVDGDELDLRINGTTKITTGNCVDHTIDARFVATLTGDVLVGRINYTIVGTGADCAPYDGCISYQDMNGTRPPR